MPLQRHMFLLNQGAPQTLEQRKEIKSVTIVASSGIILSWWLAFQFDEETTVVFSRPLDEGFLMITWLYIWWWLSKNLRDFTVFCI